MKKYFSDERSESNAHFVKGAASKASGGFHHRPPHLLALLKSEQG